MILVFLSPARRILIGAALAVLVLAPAAGAFSWFKSPGQKLIDAAARGDAVEVRSLLKRYPGILGQSRNSYHRYNYALDHSGGCDGMETVLPYSRSKSFLKEHPENNVPLSLFFDHSIGYFALMYALQNDRADMVKLLLDKGALPQGEKRLRRLNELLGWAAEFGYTDIVRLLLDEGADANARMSISIFDGTPLRFAARNLHYDAARLLIEKGADVNARNQYGATILEKLAEDKGDCGDHPAIQDAFMNVAGLLLRYGADLDAKDSSGYSVSSFALTQTMAALRRVRVKRRCFTTCYIAADGTELKDAAGAVLTRLPLGTQVRDEKEENGYDWIDVGKNLSGWVKAESLSVSRPDMFAPIIRVISKDLKGPKLAVTGVVYSDKPLKALAFGGRKLSRADFQAPKGNYRHAYPFKGDMDVAPGDHPVLEAEDDSGLKSRLAVNLQAPILDYTPAYAQLMVLRSAPVLAAPSPGARVLGKVLRRSVIVSVGRKKGWFCLEGGGWLAAADAAETAGGAGEPSAESVTVSASSGPAVPEALSAPSDVDVDIPRGKPDPDAVAVIIANKDYAKPGVPAVAFALNDGRVMKKYVQRLFGVGADNIIYRENAGEGDFEEIFGNAGNYKGKLFNYVAGLDRPPDVIIYYVGTAPRPRTKKPIWCRWTPPRTTSPSAAILWTSSTRISAI